MLYVADNRYAPYGPRPATEILDRSRRITDWLLDQGAKLIVVACNTATSVAIDTLRLEHPDVPFVGLEPAVKPASRAERVGVMATRATLSSTRYQKLREEYFGNRPLLEDDCAGLVPLIEREGTGGTGLRRRLEEILEPMRAARITTLVLGCTHYPLVREDIAAVLGPEVELIDPAPAAARQVRRLLEVGGIDNPAASSEPRTFTSTTISNHARGHDFFATATALPLQRTLLTLPELNHRRRFVVPHLTV